MLFDAERFQSDPFDTRLEANDVAILLRSDAAREHRRCDEAHPRLEALRADVDPPRLRGRRLRRRASLPKQMAVAAQIPGADLIPDTSELFLGFTSTQRAGMGPGTIANFETLGYVDLRGSDYFRQGTHMHLSHIHEDVEAWYLNFDFDERVATAFRPNLHVKQNTQTVRQGPKDVSTEADVHRDYKRSGGSATARRSRRRRGSIGTSPSTDGRYPKGTAIPVRADFNTLDNPFAWSEQPDEIGATAGGRRPLRRLQPDGRRLPPQPPGDGRPATGQEDRRSSRATATRASTRSSRRRTARTSSCRRAGTAASRSPNGFFNVFLMV